MLALAPESTVFIQRSGKVLAQRGQEPAIRDKDLYTRKGPVSMEAGQRDQTRW